MDKLYAEIVAALEALGLTEIEVDLKPKNTPEPHVKLFIACQTIGAPPSTHGGKCSVCGGGCCNCAPCRENTKDGIFDICASCFRKKKVEAIAK